ncbi:MAG TPA: hypothetical protein VLL57_08025, partial [Candidatus Binataceae bacterium]|nr:hypothetical protein [Candidatus Binataceae bacterium]
PIVFVHSTQADGLGGLPERRTARQASRRHFIVIDHKARLGEADFGAVCGTASDDQASKAPVIIGTTIEGGD